MKLTAAAAKRLWGKSIKVPRKPPAPKVRSPFGAVIQFGSAIVVHGLELSNPLNGRHGHWRVQAAKRKAEREATVAVLHMEKVPAVQGAAKVSVRITRAYAGRRRPFDYAGLVASMKSVEDAVADWIGVNDGSDQWECEFMQERWPYNNAVAIEIQWGYSNG